MPTKYSESFVGSGNNLVYSQGGKQFWVQRNNHDLWCAGTSISAFFNSNILKMVLFIGYILGAYIINKDKLRGHIEHLIKEQSDGR